MAASLFLLSLSAGIAARGSIVQRNSAEATPTEKVIDLLKGLRGSVVEESSTEAAKYNTFSCFCKSKTEVLSQSISSGKTTIDTLSADIEAKTASRQDKSTQLTAANAKLQDLSVKLKETGATLEKEKLKYDASNADLEKAIASLASATHSMESSKPKAQLLTVKKAVAATMANPALAEAMRLVDAGAKWKDGDALLQLQAAVDPSDPTYKYHSHEIIATLQKLHVEFTTKKEEADATYAQTFKSLKEIETAYTSESQSTSNEINALESDISALTSEVASARQSLVEMDSMLKDDKLYMTDLTSLCETRAKQWDQRSSMRADELKALSEAIDILEGKVLGTSEYSKRALLQDQRADETQSRASAFLQRISVHAHGASERRANLEQDHKARALKLLAEEGQRLRSSKLSALAARVSSDPFTKVKNLIQQLVERLLAEATNEATKKGFCDTETAKAMTDRDFRLAEVQKLNAEIAQLEAKEGSLSLEMDSLKNELQELADTANETSSIRAGDKGANVMTIAQSREGLAAVTEALSILKAFYKEAAKESSFAQIDASPVDEDNPGAGFDSTYSGKQAESKGVIGLLEVIKSDFERTIATTEREEKQAAAAFVEFDRTTKSAQSGKGTKVELNGQDLATTQATKETKLQDLKANMGLLDSAVSELEDLKPACVDNVMSYEDRVKKRDEEVEALKRALCILDPDGVEEQCV